MRRLRGHPDSEEIPVTSRVSAEQIAAARAYPLPALVGRDLRLMRVGRQQAACCPFHAERTPSFFVWSDHYHCYGCGAHGDPIDYLMATRRIDFPAAVVELTGQAPSSTNVVPLLRQFSLNSAARSAAPPVSSRIAELWAGADNPRLAELYLWTRGISLRPKPLPEAIRGHSAVWCSETREMRPAMLAALTDASGAIRALQRVWCEARLDVTGGVPDKGSRSIDLRAGKKTLGHMGSAAVRLAEPRNVLGLAEGVESALAAAQLFSMPVWAVCGASRLGAIAIPEGVSTITIYGDDGASGHDAAMVAARKYQGAGYRVDVEFPPAGCDDWNTYLREKL